MDLDVGLTEGERRDRYRRSQNPYARAFYIGDDEPPETSGENPVDESNAPGNES